MEHYGDNFYRNRAAETNASVNVILDLVLRVVPRPRSAIDLGCGVGAWLAALKEKGTERVLGLDGPWVNRDYLAILPSEFQQHDFGSLISVDAFFDLAISLEVAEHLPIEQASNFVQSLVSLADFVLFSASPPLQGGTNHVNEQPIEYWSELFGRSGYVGIDCLRPYIWNDARILPWYRQNTILFVKNSRVEELSLPKAWPTPNGYLHPELFLKRLDGSLRKLEELDNVRGAFWLLRQVIKRRIKAALRAS